MSELIFSVVVEEIKSAFEETISDADVIQLLYDGVADPAGITNSKGESIFVSKTTAHAIVNRKRRGGNPLTIIRKHSCDPKVINL
ncbi:MAG: hypothetical protein LUC41_03985, partial [Clostridiales bacterium]|nr:hypothetical protein [Clostridiales bacterium]